MLLKGFQNQNGSVTLKEKYEKTKLFVYKTFKSFKPVLQNGDLTLSKVSLFLQVFWDQAVAYLMLSRGQNHNYFLNDQRRYCVPGRSSVLGIKWSGLEIPDERRVVPV